MPDTKTVFFRRTGALLLVLATAGCAVNGQFRATPTQADLATIQAGMTREQVLARVGPPTWVFGVWQEHLSIWNYRYSRTDCIIYQVSMRPDGIVRDSAQGYDPACDGPSHE
jgi:outer membrane protein assembly factor BamE (lipoprotein component of BamABCDE complex)